MPMGNERAYRKMYELGKTLQGQAQMLLDMAKESGYGDESMKYEEKPEMASESDMEKRDESANSDKKNMLISALKRKYAK